MADVVREEPLRVDVFLAWSRIIMPRGAAQRACDNGIVSVNDRVAKPATPVRIGDTVAIRFTDLDLVVRVLTYPRKSTPKKTAADHYEVISRRRIGEGPEI